MTATASDPITVIIADDHIVVRHGVRAFLATQPDIVVAGEAANGEEAVALCGEHAPDVALLDLVMPGMDGIDATRQIKRVSPRTQVVILTSFHEDQHIVPAIRAGALSYLLKDAAPDQLSDAIRKAARGEVVLHSRVAAHVMRAFHGSKLTETSRLAELTARELEVLRLVAEGLSNAVIAERLCISEKTVKSHVSNVLNKLHLDDRTQAAVYAWRKGLVRE
jgi:two-component system, NarL family, response regulator LiaR